MEILVTGFGPFAAAADNPSAKLAESLGTALGCPFEVIEVSFAAVDAWRDRLQSTPDILLHLGFAKRPKITPELHARNEIGTAQDVRGEVRTGLIDPSGADLPSTLFSADDDQLLDAETMDMSTDAGTYLCNYILYQSLRHGLGTRVGFIHVPTLDVVPLDRATDAIHRFVLAVTRPSIPQPSDRRGRL